MTNIPMMMRSGAALRLSSAREHCLFKAARMPQGGASGADFVAELDAAMTSDNGGEQARHERQAKLSPRRGPVLPTSDTAGRGRLSRRRLFRGTLGVEGKVLTLVPRHRLALWVREVTR